MSENTFKLIFLHSYNVLKIDTVLLRIDADCALFYIVSLIENDGLKSIGCRTPMISIGARNDSSTGLWQRRSLFAASQCHRAANPRYITAPQCQNLMTSGERGEQFPTVAWRPIYFSAISKTFPTRHALSLSHDKNNASRIAYIECREAAPFGGLFLALQVQRFSNKRWITTLSSGRGETTFTRCTNDGVSDLNGPNSSPARRQFTIVVKIAL